MKKDRKYLRRDLRKFVKDLTSEELVYLLYGKHIIDYSYRPPTAV